jgi:hypothetical protein
MSPPATFSEKPSNHKMTRMTMSDQRLCVTAPAVVRFGRLPSPGRAGCGVLA